GVDGNPGKGTPTFLHFPRGFLEQLAANDAVLTDVSATAGLLASTVTVDRVPEFVPEAHLVSGNYFRMLGIGLFLGRALTPADDQPGAPPVCVVSHDFWQRRLGASDAAVGQTILVNRLPTTIVGVTTPGFPGLLPAGRGPELTLPLSLAGRVRRDAEVVAKPAYCWVRLIGRRAPGVSTAELGPALAPAFQAGLPHELSVAVGGQRPRLLAASLSHNQTPVQRRGNSAFLVPIGCLTLLVLASSCANAATLMMARGLSRRRELATRLALGAGRGRVVRQLVGESMLLSFAGTILGVVLSRWNIAVLTTMFPRVDSGYAPWINPDDLTLSVPMIVFAGMVAVVTGVTSGLWPALLATRLNLSEEFQGGSRLHGGRTLSRMSQLLVAAQVAMACVLMVCAGLFARTVRNLGSIDLGFNPGHVLLFAIEGRPTAGKPSKATVAMYDRVSTRIRALPGVQQVTYSGWPVLTGEGGPFSAKVTVPGVSDPGPALWNPVGPDFAETYQMPLVAGRGLEERDSATEAGAVVVNQTFAEKFFPATSALGQHVVLQGKPREIVGIVRDARLVAAELREPVAPLVLIPFRHHPREIARFAVRTMVPPEAMIEAIRRAVSEVEPDRALAGVTTQKQHVEWRFLLERMYARMAGFVGLIALVLANVGLGALMAHTVVRRTGEIGVRLALGAKPTQVVRMILAQTFSVAAVGLIVGLAASTAAAQLIANRLYGLSPFDPMTYLGVAVGLIGMALLAAWLPARRAAKVDPMVALRAE
ncbi:MAG TPA: ADOP family duplicated permease, partial [Lacunisphaera sp.]|nr:ADOP family duplicated permease [Lacunisphaera sp.]